MAFPASIGRRGAWHGLARTSVAVYDLDEVEAWARQLADFAESLRLH